jgi:outer membrane protein OmpA-like peptidoglycan-associated protein
MIKAAGNPFTYRSFNRPKELRGFVRILSATLAIMAILLLPQMVSAYSAYYDWNRDVPTKTNPPVNTVVNFDTDTRLDMVRIYHLAPTRPITVTLAGCSGSYKVSNFVKTNSFGAKKDLQVFVVEKTGIIVKAGSYKVTSSDPATWFYNAGTGNRGFLAINGTRQPRDLGQLKVGERIVLENILFISDSAGVLPSSQSALEALYNSLLRNKTVKIELRGHINGPNQKLDMKASGDLGGQRAKTISDYLVNKGIDKERVSYKGYGNTQMLHPKPQSAEQESANRRVEAVVVGR